MEHGLLGVELGDWWEDTASIAGEEDDVGGVVIADTWDLGVLDVLDWVSAITMLAFASCLCCKIYLPTSVFCQGSVIVINGTGSWVENDVLENGAEANGTENIWFLLCG